MSRCPQRFSAVLIAIALLLVQVAPAAATTGQGLETLIYVLSFLIIPYVIVSGVLFSIRRLFAQERGL